MFSLYSNKFFLMKVIYIFRLLLKPPVILIRIMYILNPILKNLIPFILPYFILYVLFVIKFLLHIRLLRSVNRKEKNKEPSPRTLRPQFGPSIEKSDFSIKTVAVINTLCILPIQFIQAIL